MEAIVVALIGALATIAAAMITTRNTAKSSSQAYGQVSVRREDEVSSARTRHTSVEIPPSQVYSENVPIKRSPPNPIASRLSWTLAWGMIGILLVNIYLVVFPEQRGQVTGANLVGFCIGSTCGLIYGRPTAKSLALLLVFPPLITLFFSFQQPFSSVGLGLFLGMPLGSIAGMFHKKLHRE
jgi:hypothetical protein